MVLALEIILVIAAILMSIFVLLHKGKGGGLSDMFGGGMSTSLGSSSVAERNLTRFTIVIALVWIVAVVGVGMVDRFAN